VILLGIGKNSDLLWAVLPVAVFLAGYLPVVASFGAGQAAFTMTVVILFNLIQPTGWQVGLVRVEDIAIGCAVSVVVGLLFWPRGASNQLARSLGEAYRTAADYVVGIAVQLRTPDPSAVALSRSHASDAYQRMDEAFRQFLAERGEKRIPLDVATDLVTGVLRVTLAGDSLAGMTPVRWAQTGELPAPIMAADAQLRVAFDCCAAGSTTSPRRRRATVTCRRSPSPTIATSTPGSSRASARPASSGVSHRCSSCSGCCGPSRT